ncbi:MAG: response regulator transcription factor [Ignavibacteria bacterium]|nr:response regulator transcription factor [Ignavibacteria bacterium]
MKPKILLVDDERDIIEFLQYNLEKNGFEVFVAYDGLEALTLLPQNPDLIVLDVLMPKMDGYEVCTKIRMLKDYKRVPIIFLTAKATEYDEVHGLNIGANDYIKKPISPRKLIARINANLRKNDKKIDQLEVKKEIKIGPLTIDREKYIAKVDSKKLTLPKKEFEILAFLAENPGKVFPREKILTDVWGENIFVVERTIDVHIRKLRVKLKKYSNLIETIKGVGYRFKNFE